MTALFIFGVIFFIVLILLLAHVRAEIKIYKGELDFKINYLFLTLFPLKEIKIKKNKKIKKQKASKKDILSDNTENIPNEKENESFKVQIDDNQTEEHNETVSNINDEELLLNPEKIVKEKLPKKLDDIIVKWNKIKLVYESSKKGLKKLYKGIRVDDIIIDFRTADEDAYKAAMKYGQVSAVTYNAISALRCFFNISVISVDVNCIFNSSESFYEGEFKVRMSLAVLLSGGIIILYGLFRNRKEIFDK